MATPLNLEGGQSSTKPPRFNGQFYRRWKTRMHDFLIFDGPYVRTLEVKEGEITSVIPKI